MENFEEKVKILKIDRFERIKNLVISEDVIDVKFDWQIMIKL